MHYNGALISALPVKFHCFDTLIQVLKIKDLIRSSSNCEFESPVQLWYTNIPLYIKIYTHTYTQHTHTQPRAPLHARWLQVKWKICWSIEWSAITKIFYQPRHNTFLETNRNDPLSCLTRQASIIYAISFVQRMTELEIPIHDLHEELYDNIYFLQMSLKTILTNEHSFNQTNQNVLHQIIKNPTLTSKCYYFQV